MRVVISDNCQVFPFEKARSAYDFGVTNFGVGHFLLHKCEKDSLEAQIL
ncbi:MAG: hypothetical protein MJ198_00245 [Bacteroidales bacterium]|nr:hypothetical protein [Bacteroidales bacterium]